MTTQAAWVLMAGFLAMFMHLGFALVETGLCRAKNAAHTMSMNLMVYALACLAFWATASPWAGATRAAARPAPPPRRAGQRDTGRRTPAWASGPPRPTAEGPPAATATGCWVEGLFPLGRRGNGA